MAEEQKVEQPVLTLNEQLTKISEILQGQTTTRLVCDKLVEIGNVKIVDNTPPKDGEEPIAIIVTGDVVANVLKPVIDLINLKREQSLAIKEQVLLKMQGEVEKK